jgi:hypothetical protein
MSNSARIWIGYLLIALTPLALGVAALAGEMVPADNKTLANIVILLIFAAWSGLLFAHQAWANCWRCGEKLHRVADRLHSPIILRRHCFSCGVRHSSRPADVRANPLGHFGKANRG